MKSYLDIDLAVTPELQQLKETTHAFARDVLRPASAALDGLATPEEVIDPSSIFWDTLRAGYQRGYHAMLLPTELGGLGLHGLSLHIVLEELAWGSAEFATSLAVAGFPFASVAATRDMGLIQEVVLPFVADRDARMIGCWGVTEMAHGSDQFILGAPEFNDPRITRELVARRDGDEFVIDGSKAIWVSNGSIATQMIAYLTLEPSMGMAGGGVAYIPLDLPGVSKGAPLDKMGQHALPQGQVFFENVRIPARYVIVDTAAYTYALNQTLVLTNAVMGAMFTGVARAAYEEALAYTRTRVQGGKPICEHQLVQKHLFDMFTKVETCRALSRSVMAYNDGDRMSLQHSIAAKTYCTQASYEVADIALQLHGGRGLTRGTLVEKLFRDTRASLIEDGANDILALAGARRILAGEVTTNGVTLESVAQ